MAAAQAAFEAAGGRVVEPPPRSGSG